ALHLNNHPRGAALRCREIGASEPEPTGRRTVRGKARSDAVFGQSRGAFRASSRRVGPVRHALRSLGYADRSPCAQRRLDACDEQYPQVPEDTGAPARQLGLARVGERPMSTHSYSSYLEIDKLLSAQRSMTDSDDELLFIVIHQAHELWF